MRESFFMYGKSKKAAEIAAFFNNLLQTCKPDSVFRLATEGYHLSGCYITVTILLPTLQHRASSPQTLIYVALQYTRFTHNYNRLQLSWAFTSRFHPFLFPIKLEIDGYFLWHFLPDNRDRLLTGVLLYTVRTFLPDFHRSDNPVCSIYKITNFKMRINNLILKKNLCSAKAKIMMILIGKSSHFLFWF